MSANATVNQSPELSAGRGKIDVNPTNHVPRQRSFQEGESSHFSLKEAHEPWKEAVIAWEGGSPERAQHPR